MIHRRPSLFWPIILIGVGVIFLLYNMNLITGNPWPMIFNLWPVLLIVIGLDILLGRRSAAGSIVSAVLALLVVAGAIWLLVARPNLPFLVGGELKHENLAYDLKDIRTAHAEIDFSTGESRLYALSDSSKLIEGRISHYGDLNWRVDESGERADIRVGTVASINVFGVSGETWDIGLNPRVTYNLEVNLGAGRATIDLSDLELSGGSIDVGVGSAEVRLPDSGRFRLRINGGVGGLTIIAPREIALRAEVNTGIGSFNNSSRLRSVGERAYETEDFGSAENSITLDVDVGVGSVTIRDN